jgi:hypothetical protein
MYKTVYSTDVAPIITEDDTIVYPQAFQTVLDGQVVQLALADGRLVDVHDRITKKDSTPEAYACKQQTNRLNAQAAAGMAPVPPTMNSDAAE